MRRPRAGFPKGVRVEPDPPRAGEDATFTLENGAEEATWRIPPDGVEHTVRSPGGKFTVRIPPGAAGREISIWAGKAPNVVSERFDIVSTR